MTIAERQQRRVSELRPGEFWDIAPVTHVRGEPEYHYGVRRMMLPIHAFDTVRAATFKPSDRHSEVQILARIDADGMAPVIVRANVELNAGYLVAVPAVGDDDHEEPT